MTGLNGVRCFIFRIPTFSSLSETDFMMDFSYYFSLLPDRSSEFLIIYLSIFSSVIGLWFRGELILIFYRFYRSVEDCICIL